MLGSTSLHVALDNYMRVAFALSPTERKIPVLTHKPGIQQGAKTNKAAESFLLH